MKSLYEVGKEQTGSWCSDTIIEMKEEISMKKVLLMVEEGNMSHIVNARQWGLLRILQKNIIFQSLCCVIPIMCCIMIIVK